MNEPTLERPILLRKKVVNFFVGKSIGNQKLFHRPRNNKSGFFIDFIYLFFSPQFFKF